jgi:hypothetical protein
MGGAEKARPPTFSSDLYLTRLTYLTRPTYLAYLTHPTYLAYLTRPTYFCGQTTPW